LIRELTPQELKDKLDSRQAIQIIDIREIHEIEICSINGIHIPMAEILDRNDEIRKDCIVVIHCRTGKRSAAVIHTLQIKFSFTNLYNLEGGIMAWAETVEPEMERY
jgi:rhodanese-related sulfurtransferase